MSFVEATLQAMGVADAREQNARALALAAIVGDGQPEKDWAVAARRRVALRHALLRAALGQITDVLAGDIPHIVLKGEALAKMLYGDASRRSSTDIDLLVLPGDYEEVRRRLIAIGFVPVQEEGPRKWAYNQEALRHSTHGAIVEIHWMLAFPALPAMSPGPLFDTRQPFELGPGLVVDVLRGDWMGIHLALHFHQHMGFAKGLLDMAAWCDTVAPTLERATFLEMARKLKLQGVVQWPLHTLALLVGERPPMYVDGVDQTVKVWAQVSAWALRDCISRDFDGGVQDSLASLNPTISPAVGVPLRALSMAVVDGAPPAKFGACLRPLLQGPHRMGRVIRRWHLVR